MTEDALVLDDQCSADAHVVSEACSLSAMQLAGRVRREAGLNVATGLDAAPPPPCASARSCGSHAEQPWAPEHHGLLDPSSAEAYTFYMYRAQDDKSYPMENVNTGNLAGIMWYLQNEIMSGKWGSTDRFGIDRIRRIKVQTRATQPLIDKSMNFGLRVAFDAGQCTNKACGYDWWLYGFNVGCNNLGQYPFPMFETFYDGAIWYSLPGECPSAEHSQHSSACRAREPGGRCSGVPTGQGNCTYSYEAAGAILLADLYGNETKEHFWAAPSDRAANSRRVSAARRLFDAQHPDMQVEAEMPAPPCDFNREDFFTCPECR